MQKRANSSYIGPDFHKHPKLTEDAACAKIMPATEYALLSTLIKVNGDKYLFYSAEKGLYRIISRYRRFVIGHYIHRLKKRPD